MSAVLIVEPDPGTLAALCRVASAVGSPAAGTTCAEQALARIRAGAAPRAVLSAYRLPGMSGVDLLLRVAWLLPRSHRVLYTAEPEVAHLLRGAPFTVLGEPRSARALRAALSAVNAARVRPGRRPARHRSAPARSSGGSST